jgi:hypothetical protein
MRLRLAGYEFNCSPTWSVPIDYNYTPSNMDVELFDQNGYDLTALEKLYAIANGQPGRWHRPNHYALKYDWFTDDDSNTGAHINHALCFERKSYSGEALAQLQSFAKTNNLIYKILKMRPKWGLDISLDFVDEQGNVFEVLHWEWDGFNHDEVNDKKKQIEPFLLSVDWNDAARKILARKDEWHHLGFFEQSAWKTRFFGIEKERFKMVLWQ